MSKQLAAVIDIAASPDRVWAVLPIPRRTPSGTRSSSGRTGRRRWAAG